MLKNKNLTNINQLFIEKYFVFLKNLPFQTKNQKHYSKPTISSIYSDYLILRRTENDYTG